MKIFSDTTKTEAIAKAAETGLVNGVTTNPTKILETGRPFREVIREICSLVDGPVSAEAIAEKAGDIVREAEQIASVASNVAIKVPMTPEGLKACVLLATSIKSSDAVLHCMRCGCDIISIPDSLFFELFTHPLTDSGLSGFDSDWNKLIEAGLV